MVGLTNQHSASSSPSTTLVSCGFDETRKLELHTGVVRLSSHSCNFHRLRNSNEFDDAK